MKFFWSCSIQSICVRLFRVRLAWRFSVKEKILDCVKGGGTLIVEGVESIELFRKELQIDECVPVQERPLSIVRGGDMRVWIEQNYAKIKTKDNIKRTSFSVFFLRELSMLL